MKLGIQSIMKFLIANPTDFNIIFSHGYIVQVVQVTKHTDFAKLCHAGEQSKLYIPVLRFQSAIKWLQGISELLLKFFIANGL